MCLWVHEYMCSCRHVQPMYINHGVQLYMTTCTCIYICPQYKIISKPSFYICAFTVVQSKFQDSYRNTILPSFCLIELQEDVENRKQNRVYPCMMVVMVNTITHTHTHTHTQAFGCKQVATQNNHIIWKYTVTLQTIVVSYMYIYLRKTLFHFVNSGVEIAQDIV